MPTKKEETFSFGGVDSRSNPANYPVDRALRCLNFKPQISGLLRLRDGYTVPSGATSDGIPIHSAIYYEQFSAAYVGPQYVLYGKNDIVNILNIQTGQVNMAANNRKLPAPSGMAVVDGGAGGTLEGATYYYVVTALDGAGGETQASAEVSITVVSNHKVNLSWNVETGAAAFNVYRGIAPGGELKLIGTGLPVATPTHAFVDDGSYTTLGSATIASITATGGGSPLATIEFAFSTAAFIPGQSVVIAGNDVASFNVVATVVSVIDDLHIVVSSSAFTAAGIPTVVSVTQGPLLPQSLLSVAGPNRVWSISGGQASITMQQPGTLNQDESNILRATNIMASIPSTSTITGIGVTVSRATTTGPPQTITDFVRLEKSTIAIGATKSGIPWTFTPQSEPFGGQFDKWSTGLTPADVNNSTFGAGFRMASSGGTGSRSGTAYTITFTIYYEVPGGVPLVGFFGTLASQLSVPPTFNTTQANLTAEMGSNNPWGHFRSASRVFISSGAPWTGRFFQTDLVSWDGAELRPVGLPPLSDFSNATGGPVVVDVTTSTMGSIAPTLLSGYQLYGAIYNPLTQHMGNRYPLGDRQTVTNTGSVFELRGLPNPWFDGGFDDPYDEWVLAIGRTQDGGEVPYWFIDAQGNNIFIGNTATMGTIFIDAINVTQELPILNDLPPLANKYARVGTRIFANMSGNPFLNYSNDEADVSNANYVGQPVESWPADQAEPLPTGELPTAIHAYRLEGWFFSRNNLCIWSQFLLQQGVNPWRGPWPGGCPAQRAFVETPYGPFWVNSDKQLATFMEDGVISVSDEYEAALLGQIADQFISQTEIAYLRDQAKLIDQIVVKGINADGDVVIVVHDFKIKDQRSPTGQGYMYAYTGVTINTFAGSGFTPRQNVYDPNGKMRLWAGAVEGFFAQLEDGGSDNGAEFAADYIGLISVGPGRPGLADMEYQGDPELEFSYSQDYSITDPDEFKAVEKQLIPGETSRYDFSMIGEARWAYVRFQLSSHSADGNFALTDPPFLPMPTYGEMNLAVLKLGRDRPEGR